jgi:NAD(P)H dehydrogenase (quinone)
MKVLVVFAHPQRASFCGAALDRFLQGLEVGRHEVRVRDLYALNFKADLSALEFERERETGRASALPPDVLEEQQHVLWADVAAFVCPLWWSDVPAILKGWFDRVWTKGFAWTYEGESELKQRKPAAGLLLVTAGNTEEKLLKDGIISALRAATLGDRILNVGFQSASLVLLAGLDKASRERLDQLLERAYDAGKSLASA